MRFGIAVFLTALVVSAFGATASGAVVMPPVSSLRSLPAPPKLLPGYVDALSFMAKRTGLSPMVAARRTRLLLSNVTGLPLYAFAAPKSRVCFVVWRGLGECGTLDASHKITWGINGGSWKRGQAVVGVVTDNVRAVDVYLGHRHVRAAVRHNAFVVPFRLGKAGSYPRIRVAPVVR